LGSLFGAEIPQIEHEHDDEDEHDDLSFGIWVNGERRTANGER
jgi:hypothetical protein